MKNIFSTTQYVCLLALGALLFPVSFLFADAEFQSFSVQASLDAECHLTGSFDVAINPSTITSGSSFVLVIDKMENGSSVQNNMDNTFTVPLNGIVNNQNISGSSFTGSAEYQFQIVEQNATGQTGGQSNLVSLVPTPGSCGDVPEGPGEDQNPNDENQDVGVLEIEIENPISVNSVPLLIKKILEIMIKIGIPLLVVMLVYSGALYLFAQGNQNKLKSAHDMFLYTLIGGAILLGAWGLVELMYATLIDLTASLIKIFV